MTKVKDSFYKYDACDGGCNRFRRVRRLSISDMPGSAEASTAGLFLCEYCWRDEMDWRRKMNHNIDGGYGDTGPWLVFHFYHPSPLGDDVEIAYDQFPDEFFDDTGLDACQIFSPNDGKPIGFAIMDDDGNTVDYARDMLSLLDYLNDVRDARARENKAEETHHPLHAFKDRPELSDQMIANPRLVLLWDRVSGSATFDRYSVWIVYENTRRLFKTSTREEGLHVPIHAALDHAIAITSPGNPRDGQEYVVVVLPQPGSDDGGVLGGNYVEEIGQQVLLQNKQAFADRGRTK